jgi:hypothetical protein
MLKQRIAMLGIILFAVSLFPLNAPAEDAIQNQVSTQKWEKHKAHSKAKQGKLTSHKKPKPIKRKA